MSAYEIMLSESQERMLLVVEQGKEEEILHIFEKYDVPAAVIGKVIEEKAFRIIHQEKIWAEVPVDALDEDAPVYHLPSKEPVLFKENQKKTAKLPKIEDISTAFKEMLKRRSEEHTSELQSRGHLVCRLLLEKKKQRH